MSGFGSVGWMTYWFERKVMEAAGESVQPTKGSIGAVQDPEVVPVVALTGSFEKAYAMALRSRLRGESQEQSEYHRRGAEDPQNRGGSPKSCRHHFSPKVREFSWVEVYRPKRAVVNRSRLLVAAVQVGETGRFPRRALLEIPVHVQDEVGRPGALAVGDRDRRQGDVARGARDREDAGCAGGQGGAANGSDRVPRVDYPARRQGVEPRVVRNAEGAGHRKGVGAAP